VISLAALHLSPHGILPIDTLLVVGVMIQFNSQHLHNINRGYNNSIEHNNMIAMHRTVLIETHQSVHVYSNVRACMSMMQHDH
jgi:hypothetical protein